MVRLVDFYAPLISFGLELDAAIAAGGTPLSGQQAQEGANRLLQQARKAALAAGKPQRAVESASFAMVAWFDEIVARNPAWGSGLTPLQVLLFNSNNAHTEFFHHLSALQPNDDEVREVYWHALAHGFAGQYYFEQGDAGELGKLKDLHAQQLPLAPLELATLAHDRITPQPYSLPDPPGPRNPQQRKRAVLRTAGALALLLPAAWLLANWFLPAHTPETPLARRIDQRLQRYPCADLSATINADGNTRVTGFVSRPEDVLKVEREIAALPGVTTAGFDLQLRYWPHCEVVSILKPYRVRNRDKQAGLALVAATAREGRLREGDRVLLQVTNARQDGYLWVDYYTADGAVLHFHADKGPARVVAGERIELGQDIPSSWLASPPFGAVLVTVLSSPAPFRETADRPPFELASDYLLRLRQVLAANKGGDGLVADYVFLYTVAR
jgi:type IV/VI secretion system ImpK/VasF family protein